MRRVVSNTGPLLHLSEASNLDLLSRMGEVHIPRGVEREIAYHISTWITPTWIMVDALDEPHATDSVAWQQAGLLQIGEAEAIALARQLEVDWLLTDDAAARLVAQKLGLYGSQPECSLKPDWRWRGCFRSRWIVGEVADGIVIEFDKDNQPIGIEILNASKVMTSAIGRERLSAGIA